MAWKGVDPRFSGDGVYRFLLGDALLDCRKNKHDDELYAESVEYALAVAEDLIQTKRAWWDAAMYQVLVDEAGKHIVDANGALLLPNVEIPKKARHRQVAAIYVLARRCGVFAAKPQEMEDAVGFFEGVLKERGGADSELASAQAHGDEEDDDEDET